MRTLKILGAVQTVLLLVLVGKVFLFADDSTGTDTLTRTEPEAPPGVVSGESPSMDLVATHRIPGDDRLRTIIREELASLTDRRGASAEQAPEIDESESIATPDSWYQRQEVAGQIEFYTSVGSISHMEMQRLQGEIAKLDKKSAQEMLKKLVGALNSGELKGEL